MRALVQRVTRCRIRIDGKTHSAIEQGLLVLLGVKEGDDEKDAEYLAERCAAFRIFADPEGKMNLSVQDVSGSVMVVSQFTLYGDSRKGNRPSYTEAAPPDVAERLYEVFIGRLKGILGGHRVASGIFRAMMEVELINDGPVTLMIESKNNA